MERKGVSFLGGSGTEQGFPLTSAAGIVGNQREQQPMLYGGPYFCSFQEAQEPHDSYPHELVAMFLFTFLLGALGLARRPSPVVDFPEKIPPSSCLPEEPDQGWTKFLASGNPGKTG